MLNKEQQGTALLETLPLKTYKKHAPIYRPGERADRIFILKKGRVKVGSHYDYPKAIIKNVLTTGELFGELSMIGQLIRKDFATAMEDTELYVVTTDVLKQLMRQHQPLMSTMMKILGTRLIEMEQRLESFVCKSSRTRIIDFLDRLVKRQGQRVGYEMLVRGFFTHQEIANITATSRQTVTTVLNELRNKNILTFNRRRLLIRDWQLLRAEVA
ncbi:MAG: Crp/Fnr family transcriptional regulator [Bacteroidota bacterium]